MAEIDLELVRKLAESAEARAQGCHDAYEAHTVLAQEHQNALRNLMAANHRLDAQSKLNDYFYWIGHANAYKGIVAMVELATVVEDEMDATPQCP